MIKHGQRHGCWGTWCGAMLLAVSVLLGGGVLATTQAPHYRVAVLLPKPTFNLVLEGLREGLTQLGYQEDKNLSMLVEDAQGDIASLTPWPHAWSQPSPMSCSPSPPRRRLPPSKPPP